MTTHRSSKKSEFPIQSLDKGYFPIEIEFIDNTSKQQIKQICKDVDSVPAGIAFKILRTKVLEK